MSRIYRFIVALCASPLLIAGGACILFAETELRRGFSIDLNRPDAQQGATILNQYRFLKGIEFASGVICIAPRREIFSAIEPAKAFLLVVFAGVCEQSFSVIVDGTPSLPFLLFLAYALLVGVLVGFDVWRRAAHA